MFMAASHSGCQDDQDKAQHKGKLPIQGFSTKLDHRRMERRRVLLEQLMSSNSAYLLEPQISNSTDTNKQPCLREADI